MRIHIYIMIISFKQTQVLTGWVISASFVAFAANLFNSIGDFKQFSCIFFLRNNRFDLN